MDVPDIAIRLKGHRATHPGASRAFLEDLVTRILEMRDCPMEPSIGRIVHYFPERFGLLVDNETPVEPQAAIITRVLGGEEKVVFLHAFGVEQDSKHVARFGDGEPGTWVWPPRV